MDESYDEGYASLYPPSIVLVASNLGSGAESPPPASPMTSAPTSPQQPIDPEDYRQEQGMIATPLDKPFDEQSMSSSTKNTSLFLMSEDMLRLCPKSNAAALHEGRPKTPSPPLPAFEASGIEVTLQRSHPLECIEFSPEEDVPMDERDFPSVEGIRGPGMKLLLKQTKPSDATHSHVVDAVHLAKQRIREAAENRGNQHHGYLPRGMGMSSGSSEDDELDAYATDVPTDEESIRDNTHAVSLHESLESMLHTPDKLSNGRAAMARDDIPAITASFSTDASTVVINNSPTKNTRQIHEVDAPDDERTVAETEQTKSGLSNTAPEQNASSFQEMMTGAVNYATVSAAAVGSAAAIVGETVEAIVLGGPPDSSPEEEDRAKCMTKQAKTSISDCSSLTDLNHADRRKIFEEKLESIVRHNEYSSVEELKSLNERMVDSFLFDDPCDQFSQLIGADEAIAVPAAGNSVRADLFGAKSMSALRSGEGVREIKEDKTHDKAKKANDIVLSEALLELHSSSTSIEDVLADNDQILIEAREAVRSAAADDSPLKPLGKSLEPDCLSPVATKATHGSNAESTEMTTPRCDTDPYILSPPQTLNTHRSWSEILTDLQSTPQPTRSSIVSSEEPVFTDDTFFDDGSESCDIEPAGFGSALKNALAAAAADLQLVDSNADTSFQNEGRALDSPESKFAAVSPGSSPAGASVEVDKSVSLSTPEFLKTRRPEPVGDAIEQPPIALKKSPENPKSPKKKSSKKKKCPSRPKQSRKEDIAASFKAFLAADEEKLSRERAEELALHRLKVAKSSLKSGRTEVRPVEEAAPDPAKSEPKRQEKSKLSETNQIGAVADVSSTSNPPKKASRSLKGTVQASNDLKKGTAARDQQDMKTVSRKSAKTIESKKGGEATKFTDEASPEGTVDNEKRISKASQVLTEFSSRLPGDLIAMPKPETVEPRRAIAAQTVQVEEQGRKQGNEATPTTDTVNKDLVPAEEEVPADIVRDGDVHLKALHSSDLEVSPQSESLQESSSSPDRKGKVNPDDCDKTDVVAKGSASAAERRVVSDDNAKSAEDRNSTRRSRSRPTTNGNDNEVDPLHVGPDVNRRGRSRSLGPKGILRSSSRKRRPKPDASIDYNEASNTGTPEVKSRRRSRSLGAEGQVRGILRSIRNDVNGKKDRRRSRSAGRTSHREPTPGENKSRARSRSVGSESRLGGVFRRLSNGASTQQAEDQLSDNLNQKEDQLSDNLNQKEHIAETKGDEQLLADLATLIPGSISEESGRSDTTKVKSNARPVLVQSMDNESGIPKGDIMLSLLNGTLGQDVAKGKWAARVQDAIWRCRTLRKELDGQTKMSKRSSFSSSSRMSIPVDVDDVRVVGGVRNVAKIEAAALDCLRLDKIDDAIEFYEDIIFAYYSFFEEEFKKRESHAAGKPAAVLDFKPYVGAALHNLGVLHLLNGDPREALSFFERATENRRTYLGKDHVDYITSLSRQALCRYSLDDYAKAHSLLEEALSLCKQCQSNQQNKEQIAEILNNLGCLSYMCGSPGSAIKLFQESLDVQFDLLNASLYSGTRRSGHTVSLNISIARANIGFLKLLSKDAPVAIQAFEAALMEQQILFSHYQETIITTMDHLAVANLLNGDKERALQMLGRILQLQLDEYHAKDERCLFTINKINMVRSQGKTFEAAVDKLRKGLSPEPSQQKKNLESRLEADDKQAAQSANQGARSRLPTVSTLGVSQPGGHRRNSGQNASFAHENTSEGSGSLNGGKGGNRMSNVVLKAFGGRRKRKQNNR